VTPSIVPTEISAKVSLPSIRHPERSECEAFAQSKDPAAFLLDHQRRTRPTSPMAAPPLCAGRERNPDGRRPVDATNVLRLSSIHRDWKSGFSARLTQDDGTGKQHFRRVLLRDALPVRGEGVEATGYSPSALWGSKHPVTVYGHSFS
jgi:hypothetical protein